MSICLNDSSLSSYTHTTNIKTTAGHTTRDSTTWSAFNRRSNAHAVTISVTRAIAHYTQPRGNCEQCRNMAVSCNHDKTHDTSYKPISTPVAINHKLTGTNHTTNNRTKNNKQDMAIFMSTQIVVTWMKVLTIQ